MRYTKRLKSLFRVDKDGTEHWNEYISVSDRALADEKLCQHEDIDDDLGIEWSIVYQALKDGIYWTHNAVECRSIVHTEKVKGLSFNEKWLVYS